VTIPDTRLAHIDDSLCRGFLGSVELVGKRWSSGILLALARGAERFSEIIASIPGLSDRVLAERLRELESVGLLRREVIATMPVQVRYRLTDRGADLLDSLQPLVGWSQRWEKQPPTSID
jgi:DNA-binding HxlR family transcriptional regulator